MDKKSFRKFSTDYSVAELREKFANEKSQKQEKTERDGVMELHRTYGREEPEFRPDGSNNPKCPYYTKRETWRY